MQRSLCFCNIHTSDDGPRSIRKYLGVASTNYCWILLNQFGNWKGYIQKNVDKTCLYCSVKYRYRYITTVSVITISLGGLAVNQIPYKLECAQYLWYNNNNNNNNNNNIYYFFYIFNNMDIYLQRLYIYIYILREREREREREGDTHSTFVPKSAPSKFFSYTAGIKTFTVLCSIGHSDESSFMPF